MDSDDARRVWTDRSGEFSPKYYAHHGPNATSEAIGSILDRRLDRGASVLEVGCSCGRHLSHLLSLGFDDLSGIEINDAAVEVMEETYPDLAAQGTFYLDAVESVVTDFDDGQFDAVYSVETLQHIHPDDEWVYGELARIADSVLITAESDSDDGRSSNDSNVRDVTYVSGEVPLYHRDWTDLFTGLGLEEIDVITGHRNTVRTFRTPDGPTTS